jgi:DNA-binding LytR/AlgR family response regulator
MTLSLFIAEDEAPARERLIETIARVEPAAQIAGWAPSVRGAEAWLRSHPAPDLMLLDLQLEDGLSLELFTRPEAVLPPTVFVTAYDEFVLDAFQAQAVDYLLKPVDADRLRQAFDRLARWRRHFTAADAAGLRHSLAAPPKRQRLLGQRGTQQYALAVADVAGFVSIDKSSYAVMSDGSRFGVEGTLAEIEPTLDAAQFFRVSRQLIVAAAAVVRLTAIGKGRLQLVLKPDLLGEVTVSQERAAAFRDWLSR